jgi:hypothetical protein
VQEEEQRHCSVEEAVGASVAGQQPPAAPVRHCIPVRHNTGYTAAAGSLPIL